MSFSLTSPREHRTVRPAWSGSAFIVEALFVLLFLAASSALFVRLFAHAVAEANLSMDLSQAVAQAQDVAECFAADPQSVEEVTISGDMVTVCSIEEEETSKGTLYHARISVYRLEDLGPELGVDPEGTSLLDTLPSDEPLYSVTTARYQGGDGR